MRKRQWAFTTLGVSYPAYFNVSELDDGSFEVTVRGPAKEDGSCGDTVAIRVPALEFCPLVEKIAREVA